MRVQYTGTLAVLPFSYDRSYDAEMRKPLPWLVTLLLAAAVWTAAYAAGSKKVITPKDFPAGRPYSFGIQAGDALDVAGQTGNPPKGGGIPENFEDEVRQFPANLEAFLDAGRVERARRVLAELCLRHA